MELTNKSKFNLHSFFNSLFTYIIAVIMVINCNSIYSKSIYANTISKVSMVTLLGSIVILSYLNRNSNIDWDIYIVLTILLSLYVFIYVLIQRNRAAFSVGINDLVKFILMFSLAYLVYKNTKSPLIIEAYCNVVVVIAAVSLFFWILGSNMHVLQSTGVFLSKWNQFDNYQPVPSYHNLYFETQVLDQNIRNSAIFAEAPMASLSFTIAFCLEVLYQKKSKFYILKYVVLAFAIISTISSTGYICLILVIGYQFLTKKSFEKYSMVIKAIIVPAILLIGIVLIHYFLAQKLNSNSGFSRSRDYMNSFKAWINYPFIGTGIDIDGNFILQNGIAIGKFGYSNSLGKVLGENGIYIFILYLLSIFRSFYASLVNKDIRRFFLTIILLYLFITTQFVNTYIVLFLFSLLFVWNPYNDNSKVIN